MAGIPPIREPLEESEGFLNLPWMDFFDEVSRGDAGKEWTPTFVGLGTTGTPTITGRYYQISSYLVYYNILITPGTDTTSTAGSTYCDNFPLSPYNNGVAFAVTPAVSGGFGIHTSSNNRIYTPNWTTITVPVNVMGLVEAV